VRARVALTVTAVCRGAALLPVVIAAAGVLLLIENARSAEVSIHLGAALRLAAVGSVELLAASALLSVPLGVAVGIYLAEFGQRSAWGRALRLLVHQLSVLPPVLYGLVGVHLLLRGATLDPVWAGALPLALLAWPWIAQTAEDVFARVPEAQREAAAALGARPWSTFRWLVWPQAVPRLTVGIVQVLVRLLAEAAPLVLLQGFLRWACAQGRPCHALASLPALVFSLSSGTEPGQQGGLAALALLAAIAATCWLTRVLYRRVARAPQP
jgi:phosphate transport system permease protein